MLARKFYQENPFIFKKWKLQVAVGSVLHTQHWQGEEPNDFLRSLPTLFSTICKPKFFICLYKEYN